MPPAPALEALVTRPREDAARFAEALAARGVASRIEPLLEIRSLGARVALDGVQGLVLTSSNGARALAAAIARRDLPAYAVGDATAATARELGFAAVESAGGDVADLARLIVARADPKAGDLLHAAGSSVAGDLAGALEAAGLRLRRAVLYEAIPAAALAPGTREALASGAIWAGFFFSPRTAATFASLAAAEAPGSAAAMIAFCLSNAVAAALAPLGWRALHVAAAPSQRELLASLDLVLAGGPRGRRIDHSALEPKE